jgi:hypothetical protein
LRRFAGSNEVAAEAVRHTQSPTAAQPGEGRPEVYTGPPPRFAGERGDELELRIEQFREDHANLRSKGYSDDAAVQLAELAQLTGERPMPSRRYEMLSGAVQ